MIKVIVAGAAGRMGKRLVCNIAEAADLQLCGATEYAESPLIGEDAGVVAGLGACGVSLVSDIRQCLDGADALIDFSTGPVEQTAKLAVAAGVNVVIGTTALDDQQKQVLSDLAGQGGKIVFAPNMSVGVNLLFHLCDEVAKVLDDDYDIEVVEMHHNQKKDAPSGTAAKLGEILAEARGLAYERDARHGRSGLVGARTRKEIGMHALRGGDVVGDHTVIFATAGERVELVHKASSRDTFAKGALRAVRFLENAGPGLYNMQDVLNLKKS